MADGEHVVFQGDWHRDQEIEALQRDLKNAQSTRAAAEENLARLHGRFAQQHHPSNTRVARWW